jgi:hypothetical protein
VRPLLLLLFLLSFASSSFAQGTEVETYLVVRIKLKNERMTDKGDAYYSINAEPFNNNALDIYQLVPFHKNFFVPNKAISFYYNRPDTVTKYYNYFKSESEALDFIGTKNWQLVTVLSEITSAETNSNVQAPGTYTSIKTQPVYYFRKKVVLLESLGQ